MAGLGHWPTAPRNRLRPHADGAARASERMSKLATIVEQINKRKAQRLELDSERGRIVSDQLRIRNDLQSVGQGTDLGRRYLDTLKTQ